MLQEKGGKGNFNTFVAYSGYGRGSFDAVFQIAEAMKPHDAWNWYPLWGDFKHVRNTKYGVGGPKSGGWSPVRPYTRSMAYREVSGMNAFAYPVTGYNIWVRRGTADAIHGSALSFCAPGVGVFLPNFGQDVAVPQGMIDQATTELLGKLADRKVHLGNAIAESGKTITMIASRMTKVLSAYRAIRKGKVALAARHLGIDFRRGFLHKSIADSWLEMQYGWKPLLSDIYGASEELRDKDRQVSQIVRVSRQIARTTDDPGWTYPGTSVQGSCMLSLKAYAFYRVNDETQVLLSSLGLLNPLEVAWELTPFSFIVDWFLPVGDWLTGLTAATGMTFIDGGYAIKARGKFVATNIPVDLPNPGDPIFNVRLDMKITSECAHFTRVKMSSPPRASLYIKSPYSDQRVFNALALLTQLRK